MNTLIKTARPKLPPRTMPKRVTAIFNAGKAEASKLLLENAIGGALVRSLGERTAIQHASLDSMGIGGVEDACLAAQYPLEVVVMARDFRDGHTFHRTAKVTTLEAV